MLTTESTRNYKEHVSGQIECEILIGEDWLSHSFYPANEPDLMALIEVKALPKSEKDKYTAQQAGQKKQSDINATYNQKIIAMVGTIPQSEIDTWPKQEAQALAWKADSTADVPFIQGLANERSMLLSELVPRILQKAAIYRDASSKALGQKHAAEDLL